MPERRENALFLAIAALLLLAAGLAYWLLLGRGAVPPPSPRPPEPASVEKLSEKLVVTSASGAVRIRRGGGEEGQGEARVGDELRPEDTVETGPGGQARLGAGDSYQVDLEPNSQFSVKEITAELARFRLAAGIMNASVADRPARAFEVEAGQDAVARTTGGELSVSGSEGVAAVAVRRGEAELRSGGRAVVIRAGQQSLAVTGAPPTAPSPIPSSLLLKVTWPSDLATNRRRLIVTGKTAPGAVVALGGRPVRVEPDGSFRQVVYLREGRQRLSAQARDVGGKRAEDRSPEILLDTQGAAAEFDTRALWGNEGKPPPSMVGPQPSPSGPDSSLDPIPQNRENRPQ